MVTEGKAPDFEFAAQAFRDDRSSGIHNRCLCIENGVQPAHGGCPALHEVENPAQHHGRPDEHGQVAVEGDEIAQGHGSADDPSATDKENDQRSQPCHGCHEGDDDAPQVGHAHAAGKIASGQLVEGGEA